MKKLILAALIAAAVISAPDAEGQARERKVERRANAAAKEMERRLERAEKAEAKLEERVGQVENAVDKIGTECGEYVNPKVHARRHLRSDDVALHEYYNDGAINDIRHDMLMTADLWKIKNRSHKQIWNTVNDLGEDVRVKIKGNDYKDFIKVKVDSEKAFVKDVAPVGKSKHVAKIKEYHDKFVRKDVGFEDGSDIVSLR